MLHLFSAIETQSNKLGLPNEKIEVDRSHQPGDILNWYSDLEIKNPLQNFKIPRITISRIHSYLVQCKRFTQ